MRLQAPQGFEDFFLRSLIREGETMKAYIKEAIGSFQKLATKDINGYSFTSWKTKDKKHFFLAPSCVNLNIVRFVENPQSY